MTWRRAPAAARFTRARATIAVAMLVGILVACGGDDGADGEVTEEAGAITEEAVDATEEVVDATEEAVDATEEGAEATDDGAASTTDLVIVDFGFEPESLEVEAGTTIEVVNEDAASHTVTAEDGSFDVQLAGGGDRASFVLDDPGTFPFVCAIHPAMTGTIVVG